MIGAEFSFPCGDLVSLCLEKGLIINCTHDTVIRFLPALTVSREELDEGLSIFEKVLGIRVGQTTKNKKSTEIV